MAQDVDVLVVGGGVGGVAAALAASSLGVNVLLIEQSSWLGGQLTVQGVCTPDELGIAGQQVVETCGATAGYKDLKHRIRQFYRQNTTLSAAGQAQNPFNAGRCWVNYGFAVEPLVALAVLKEMAAEQQNLQVWFQASVVGHQKEADAIASVVVQKADGTQATLTPRYVLDATETGELLPLFGLAWVIGAESRAATGEPEAPPDSQPTWIQPVTYPLALTHRTDGGNYTIPEPDNYENVKAQQGFTLVDGNIKKMFGSYQFWEYRRVIDRTLFNDARYPFDIATINTGSNDYKGPAYPSGDPAQDQLNLHNARNASRCYLYWLQTEAPRDEEGNGYPELMPNTDFWGTGDYLSPQPYIRESRRIVAMTTVKQGDIDVNYQAGPRAHLFADSCGVGNYVMDVHKGIPEMQQIESSTRPYQIPTGALVPRDCPNLLAACKNIGVTHITNGSYRLHPQEWNVGESAGTLATFCVRNNVAPSEVVSSAGLLLDYQKTLLQRGVPIFWWTDVTNDMPNFSAIQLLGVQGIFSGFPNSLAFHPNDPFSVADQQAMNTKFGRNLPWPSGNLSRSAAAQFIAEQLQLV